MGEVEQNNRTEMEFGVGGMAVVVVAGGGYSWGAPLDFSVSRGD